MDDQKKEPIVISRRSFVGGVVSYATRVKVSALDVPTSPAFFLARFDGASSVIRVNSSRDLDPPRA